MTTQNPRLQDRQSHEMLRILANLAEDVAAIQRLVYEKEVSPSELQSLVVYDAEGRCHDGKGVLGLVYRLRVKVGGFGLTENDGK